VIALAGLALHLSPWGARASASILDAGFGILRAIAPAQAPDDILVVGLDGDSAVSAEVDPVGPATRTLPDALVRIARGRPRAIALLADLPRGSLDDKAPGLDDALATALSVAQAAAPLAIGITVDSRHEVVPIHDALLRGVDSRALAFRLLPRDDDGVVRQVVLALPTQQGRWPTIAGWLCEVLDGRCDSGLIDYGLGPAYRYVPAGRLVEIRDDEALARLFRDRIVFVAPLSAAADRVAQPAPLAGWEPPSREQPAVLAHAQTVRTLLHGRPIREVPLPAMLVFITAAALLSLVTVAAAPVAMATGALAVAGACGSALVGLRLGWHAPLAAVLATLAASLVANRVLSRLQR
jgi:CHASE2 domain-containing sensor protein